MSEQPAEAEQWYERLARVDRVRRSAAQLADEGRGPGPRGGWPCDRRDAHGPHPAPVLHGCPPEGAAAVWPTEPPGECPGVRAHPGTMIGRP